MLRIAHRLARFRRYVSLLGLVQSFRLSFGLYPPQPTLALKGIGPATIRRRTSDLLVLEKMFLRREYEVPFPLEPRVIIDAGANIGLSVLFFRSVFPRALIVAVEPEDQNFQLLKKNCGHLSNVKLIKAALWSEKACVSLQDGTVEPWAYVFGSGAGEGETPTVTPEELVDLAEGNIDLFKMDIEGAERNIFSNSCRAWLSRVDTLVIELHDRFVEGCSRAFYRQILEFPFAQEVRGENVFIRFNPTDVGSGTCRSQADREALGETITVLKR